MAPSVVLIDEAMSGLNPTEIEDSMRLIRRVRDETGVTIIWVEHVVRAVMAVVERILVLNFGELIACRQPAEIARNGAVIEGGHYLGTGGLSRAGARRSAVRRLRLDDGAARREPGGAPRRGDRGDRPERRRQDDAAQGDRRHAAPDPRGAVRYEDRYLTGLRAYQVARLGLLYVPAERELFPTMTVLENLQLGAYRNVRAAGLQLGYVFGLFPRLKERQRQLAGTLSGGEQQMLAIGRALMGGPKVLMLDEPSTGLAPKAVAELYRNLSQLKDGGLTILVTEQQVPLALSLTDRAYVLEQGSIRLSGRSSEAARRPGDQESVPGRSW